MKIQHYTLFILMAAALICHGLAEDVPHFSKIILDAASVLTALAGLVMHPPWAAPGAKAPGA